MNIGEPPDFDRGEKTQITEVPKFDDFEKTVVSIRKALKERPTFDGYMTLIGLILDRALLDEATEAVKEFKEWEKENKSSNAS